MASLIAGRGHGVNGSSGVVGLAPRAKILPVRYGSEGDKLATTAWAAGVRYAVDQGATVINLSLVDSSAYPGSSAAKAIKYAQDHDVVVVAGAGNDAGTVNYPAALPGVVAVTAVDQALNFWSKSNTGEVTVAAPGVETPQADPTVSSGYVRANGTSGSTAYVSAIVALLRSKYPDLTAGQIINRLVKSASFLQHEGRKAPDRELGYGIARPGTALTMSIPKGPKRGPVIRRSSSSSADSAAGSDNSDGKTHAKKKTKRKSSPGKFLLAGGLAAAVVIVGILVAVLRSRRNGGNNGGPGSGGAAPGGYPSQPGAYPPAPQQYPGPYSQQPPHQGQ